MSSQIFLFFSVGVEGQVEVWWQFCSTGPYGFRSTYYAWYRLHISHMIYTYDVTREGRGMRMAMGEYTRALRL